MDGKKKLRAGPRGVSEGDREKEEGRESSRVTEEGQEAGYALDARRLLGRVELVKRASAVKHGPRERDELHAEHHLRPGNLDRGERRVVEVAQDMAVCVIRVSSRLGEKRERA